MKRRYGLAAIACLAIAYATIMHSLGWAETSNFALVRAVADGNPEIDRWHWETKDKSWYDGHFFSVKAPGLAFVTTPAYKALTAVGGTEASADLLTQPGTVRLAHHQPQPGVVVDHRRGELIQRAGVGAQRPAGTQLDRRDPSREPGFELDDVDPLGIAGLAEVEL